LRELRSASRAGSPLLFGLAPRGVFRASDVATGAVGSYPTFSPLPNETSVAKASRTFTCAMPPSCSAGGLFSVALSVNRPADTRRKSHLSSRSPGVTWRVALYPSAHEAHPRFARHRPLRAYDGGVRTFLPSSRLATTRPTITRLTRYLHYMVNWEQSRRTVHASNRERPQRGAQGTFLNHQNMCVARGDLSTICSLKIHPLSKLVILKRSDKDR
jgi:hypothetical protein